MILIIDELPESLNKINSMHWREKGEYIKYWDVLIWAGKNENKLERIHGKVKIHITFCFNNKQKHDWDNYIGGCKGLFDGLKNHLIDDDNMDLIVDIEFTKKLTKERQTIVEIKEAQ